MAIFQQKPITLITKQTVQVAAEPNAVYQIFNEKKQRVNPKKTLRKDDDLHVFVDDDDTPDLILENYYGEYIITDERALHQLDATFATSAEGFNVLPFDPALSGTVALAPTATPMVGAGLETFGVGLSAGAKVALGAGGLFISKLVSDNDRPAIYKDTSINSNPTPTTPSTNTALQDALAKAEADKAKAEAEVARLNDVIAQAKTNEAKTQADLAQAQADKVQAEADLATARTKLAQAEADKAKAESDKQTAEAEAVRQTELAKDAETARQTAEADKTRLEIALTDTATAKATVEANLVAANDALKIAQDALTKAEADKQAAEQALQLAQQNNGTNVADLQRQLDEANTNLTAKQTALDTATAEKERLETAVVDKNAEIATLKGQLEAAIQAKTEAEKLKVEAETAKTNAETAKAEAEKLKAESDKLKTEAETAKATAEKQLADKQTELVNAQTAKIQAEQAKTKAEADKQAAEAVLQTFIDNNPVKITFNNITKDNVVNDNESKLPEITISGTVSGTQTSDVLTVKVGDTLHKVDIVNGEFSLTVAGASLKDKPVISAEVRRGGTKIADTPHSYEVDTEIATPTIRFNTITADNKIDTAEASEKAIEITGMVTHFTAGEQLLVTVGTDTKRVAVQDDGTFSLWVAGEVLAGKPTITATITTKDTAGNTATATAIADYSVETGTSTPPPPTTSTVITLTKIANDDHINVTEKSGTVSVTGTLSGPNADTHKGKTVSMTVNGKPLTAAVQGDLSFDFEVQGADLIKHQDYELVASLTENGTTVNSEPKAYTVASDALARIHLDDVDLGLAKEVGSVRLSGKLDLSESLFGQGKNGNLIRAVVLTIDKKEFSVAVERDTHKFELTLSQAEYEALKGQPISHKVQYYNDTYSYASNIGGFPYVSVENGYNITRTIRLDDALVIEAANKIKLAFDDGNIQASNALTPNVEYHTTLTGSVVGAKAGDKVELNVAGKTYEAQVDDNLRFSVDVSVADVSKTNFIHATLNTKNAKDEAIAVYDENNVLRSYGVEADFVNAHERLAKNQRVIKHTDDKYNFPYFIHGMDTDVRGGLLHESKTPFGGNTATTPVVKYYFATDADYQAGYKPPFNDVVAGTFKSFSQEMKDHLTEVYKTFGEVINVKFEETKVRTEADSVLTQADFTRGTSDSSGYGWFGGGAIFNSAYGFSEFKKHINFHEILHTLGATHVDDTYPTYPYANKEATAELSIMSYNNNFPMTLGGRNNLGVYDLAYLHWRFGVNKTRNTGNDVYRFKPYNPMVMGGDVYIWDADGVDTFDASSETKGVYINLTPGSWIYRGDKTDTFLIKDKVNINYNSTAQLGTYFPEFVKNGEFYGVYFRQSHNVYTEGQAFIGYGTQIENVVGSAHADILHGNKADNNIFGGAGADTLVGGEGDDHLDGGAGVDTMMGGVGDDSYVVDSATDTITELTGQGNDFVYAHVDYTLPQYVERMVLMGSAIKGVGNDENNSLVGNDLDNVLEGGAGNDRLDGGRGNDTLTGGAGVDEFVFSDVLDGSVDIITDFEMGVDKIVLNSLVFESVVDVETAKTHIKYDTATGKLTYDKDGTGIADAVHFATLSTGLDEAQILYSVF